MKTIIAIIILAITIVGCSSAPATDTKTMETAIVEAGTKIAMEESAKSTVVAQMTLTQSALATSTPIATPIPLFEIWTVAQAQAIIQSNNLEFANPTKMTKEDYGIAPMNADEAIHFFTPSVCSDCGGRLFIFSEPHKLQVMKKYYDSLGESSAAFFSWTFAKDNILIQLNGDMPEDRARQYEAALNLLK